MWNVLIAFNENILKAEILTLHSLHVFKTLVLV